MAYYTYVRDLSTGGAVKLKSDKVWMLKEDDGEIVRQPFKYEDIRDPDQPLAMAVGTKLHRICILEIDETQKGLSAKIAKRGPLGPCPQTDGTVSIDINAVKKKASKRHAKPASTSAKTPRKSVQSNKDAQSSDILRRVAHQGAEHPENKAPPKAIVVKEPVEATVVEHVAVQVHSSADCASKTDGRSEAYVRSSFVPLPKKKIQINTEFDRIDTAFDSDDSDSASMSPTSLIPKVSLLSSPANDMHIATAAKEVNVDVNHDPSENRLKINNKNEYHHFMVPHHEDSADPEVASLIAENQRLSEENILLKEQVRILIHNSASLTQAVQEINTNIANMSKSKNGLQSLSFAVDLEDEFASLQLKKDDVYVGRGRVISRSALFKIEMKYLLFSQRAEKVFELISGGLDKFRLSATKGFQVFDDVDMEAVKNIVSLMYFPDDFKVTPKAMREFFQKQPFEAMRRKKKAEDGKVVKGQET